MPYYSITLEVTIFAPKLSSAIERIEDELQEETIPYLDDDRTYMTEITITNQRKVD